MLQPVDAWQSKHTHSFAVVCSLLMAKSDLVPCFYKDQDATWERPAKLLPRSQVREMKAQKLGAFIFRGRAFRFFQSIKQAIVRFFDGPLSIGNLLAVSKH